MKFAQRIFSTLVMILIPIVLVLSAVRLLLTPAFVQIEYRTPGFPSDPYGFDREERLFWSQIALDYLLNDAGIAFLGDLRFPDGSSVYNGRELAHMVDVKNVVRSALSVWYGVLALLLGLGVWGRYGGWWDDFRAGLWRGGWLTIYLVGAIIVFVMVGFGIFFVAFHDAFFDPGTWIFNYSDTLIRLFPERFWRDAFLMVGGISLAGGSLLVVRLRRKSRFSSSVEDN